MNEFRAGDLEHANDPAVSEFICIWDALSSKYRDRLLREHGISPFVERPKLELLQATTSIAQLLLRVTQLQAEELHEELEQERPHAVDAEARHVYHPFYGAGRAGGYGA